MPDSISSCGVLIDRPRSDHLARGAHDLACAMPAEFDADRALVLEHDPLRQRAV